MKPGIFFEAATFAFNAWKEQLQAAEGLLAEALEDGYSSSRILPDLLTFQSGFAAAAQGLCQILCHPAQDLVLHTNEESEMAGPINFTGFSGVRADIDVSDLVNVASSAQVIPKAHVMLRVLPGNILMVTLVGIRTLVTTLPPGTYRGTITRVVDGTTVAHVVDVHSHLGQNLRIFASGSVPL